MRAAWRDKKVIGRRYSRYLSIVAILMGVLVFAAALSGCASIASTPTATLNTPMVALPTTNLPASATPTATASPSSTNTHQPTATVVIPKLTRTPHPTLSPEDAQMFFRELLDSNLGCELPCWWGIIPGQTSGEKAQRYLETFTHINIRNISDDLHIISALIPLPEEYGTIRHKYVVRRGIVDEISAYNFDLAPNLYMTNFLKIYGPPDEIWIRTVRHREMGSQPFIIDLYYPEKGILMEYSGGMVETKGEFLHNCFEDMYSPFINLWSTDSNLTTKDVIDIFLDTENLPQPVPLSEAADMDIDTFYSVLTSGNTLCIKTPRDIWP